MWTLINCCLTYVMCDTTRKSRPNLFHHWNDCLFFKTFHFQQPIKTWQSPYMFQSICQNSLWTLINWSLMFVTLDDTRKNDLSSSWQQLFLKCLFLLTSQVPKFFLSVVHFLSEYFFGTLMSCCLTYVMCNITRESRPNLFHHWNDCLFFKTFHFQQPIRTWKSPYKFPSNCQKSLWTPIKWFLMFVTFDDTRKNDVWSSWKQLFFEMFVSIDLLGPKEMILLFAQYLSKHLVDTVKLLPDICHVR